MLNRREFVQSSIASSALISLAGNVPGFLLAASRNAAAGNDNKILVVVQLTGGNDGLNTVIPYGDDDYYRNRFTLAIDRSAVLKIDDHVGFHPSLGGFSRLLEDKQIAVLQGVGYPNPNRSHFESMDLWHTAHLKNGSVPVGWLGRVLEMGNLGGNLPAIHFGSDEQPLALATKSTPVPSIRSLENFRLEVGRDKFLSGSTRRAVNTPRPAENQLLGFIHESNKIALSASNRLEQILENDGQRGDYPQTPLGQKLRAVARLIDAGLSTRIYYVTHGNFDTHSNQAEAHAGLLSQLAGATDAFMNDMSEKGHDERIAMTMFSEFGRRVRENASRGTDHGTAAPMFVVGGKVKNGLIGVHPSLKDLDQGDLKYKIDYRNVYSGLLQDWLGVDSKPILGGSYKPTKLFA